jgi:hypothetical protein
LLFASHKKLKLYFLSFQSFAKACLLMPEQRDGKLESLVATAPPANSIKRKYKLYGYRKTNPGQSGKF